MEACETWGHNFRCWHAVVRSASNIYFLFGMNGWAIPHVRGISYFTGLIATCGEWNKSPHVPRNIQGSGVSNVTSSRTKNFCVRKNYGKPSLKTHVAVPVLTAPLIKLLLGLPGVVALSIQFKKKTGGYRDKVTRNDKSVVHFQLETSLQHNKDSQMFMILMELPHPTGDDYEDVDWMFLLARSFNHYFNFNGGTVPLTTT